jgi:hypothetical protein
LALFVAVRYLCPPVFCAQEKVGAVGQARRRCTGLRDRDGTVGVLKAGHTISGLISMVDRDRLASFVRSRIGAPSFHVPIAVPRRARLELEPLSVNAIVEAGAHSVLAAPPSTGGAAALRDLAAELGRTERTAPGPGGEGEPGEDG